MKYLKYMLWALAAWFIVQSAAYVIAAYHTLRAVTGG